MIWKLNKIQALSLISIIFLSASVLQINYTAIKRGKKEKKRFDTGTNVFIRNARRIRESHMLSTIATQIFCINVRIQFTLRAWNIICHELYIIDDDD